MTAPETEQMISAEDAAALRQSINGLVAALVRAGHERVHIGATMAAVGLAMVHVNGGDFDAVVASCLDAIGSQNQQ